MHRARRAGAYAAPSPGPRGCRRALQGPRRGRYPPKSRRRSILTASGWQISARCARELADDARTTRPAAGSLRGFNLYVPVAQRRARVGRQRRESKREKGHAYVEPGPVEEFAPPSQTFTGPMTWYVTTGELPAISGAPLSRAWASVPVNRRCLPRGRRQAGPGYRAGLSSAGDGRRRGPPRSPR